MLTASAAVITGILLVGGWVYLPAEMDAKISIRYLEGLVTELLGKKAQLNFHGMASIPALRQM
jgi:hypothetical protein